MTTIDDIKIGDPATYNMWTDCFPCTVVAVSGNVVTVQADKSRLVRGYESDGSAEYEYERNPEGTLKKFSFRKNGRLVAVGQDMNVIGGTLTIGVRRKYHDPSF